MSVPRRSEPVTKPAYRTHRKTASGNLMDRIKFFEEEQNKQKTERPAPVKLW